MEPLNPRPVVTQIDATTANVQFTVTACNACEREFVAGDEFQAYVEPNDLYVIAVHIPECPT